MKAIELIRWAMEMTDQGTAQIVNDLRDAPLTRPSPGVGNHPLWTLGHLAYIEGAIPHILLGEKNPVDHWRHLFGTGSEPKDDAAAYPPFEEVLRTYHQLRARNLKLLDEVGESGLDRVPKNIPPGFEDAMRTFGHTLLLVTLHNMVHYGHVAVARRAAGLKPLM